MIYNPKIKSSRTVVPKSGSGGFTVSVSAEGMLSLESRTGDPVKFLAGLQSLRPQWGSQLLYGVRTIKYSAPRERISRELSQANSLLRAHITASTEAYRRKKNAAMKEIRQLCEVDVPVFKYVRQWRVRDITYVKKVKLRVADATAYENSGTIFRTDTAEYRKLLELSTKVGPFDKTRLVRFTIHKTIGYWANVKTFVRNRRVIKDRRLYDKRRADWVNKNPPYRAGTDSLVAEMRQQIINLKMQLATEYNQCLAVSSAGVCGTPNECWDAAYTMLSQYLLPVGVVQAGRYGYTNSLGTTKGFCIRLEELAPGNVDQEPSWFDVFNYEDEWASQEWPKTIRDQTDNRILGQQIAPYADSALQIIEGREFSVGNYSAGLAIRGAYDRSALNLAAGGGNPFEWNFARSFAELKDTGLTYDTARDFLRSISKGKYSAALTVGMAARVYLTYKFGISPTAQEVGTLIGTSKALLKSTYPMLRTLNAYADGLAKASITGRRSVNLDLSSFVNKLFPSMWEQDLDLGDIVATNFVSDGSWKQTVVSTNYGIAHRLGSEVSGPNTSIPDTVWAQLEKSGVAPKWVWLPEKPLVFCRYDAKKVQKAIFATDFADILRSLDVLTTMWELTPLSFVVDWFTNLISSFSAMDDFVHANRLELVPNGEGPWHSTRFRLCLAVPVYRKKGTERDFTLWCHVLRRRESEIFDGSRRIRATFVEPEGARCRIRSHLHGVNIVSSDVFAYARDLMEEAPLFALLPEIKVSLNAGKLSSLLALLLSSGKSR